MYGACRSCMSSPRITLARDGQWLNETPATTPANPRPHAREISITSRIWGMPMTRSMHQDMTASAFLPNTTDAVPRSSATAALTAAVSTPIRILRDSPARVRASMSRPIQSVPKGCCKSGARFLLEKSVSAAYPSVIIPATVTAVSITIAATRNRIVCRRRFVSFSSRLLFLIVLLFIPLSKILADLILSPPLSGSSDLPHRREDPRSDFRQRR